MPSVFLSRDLSSASLFAHLMQQAGWSLQATSLLTFQEEAFELPSEPLDWLFFYSRTGVRFFQRACPIPANCQLAAMGKGTAEEMLNVGWSVNFIGKGDPKTVASSLQEISKGQRVGFVQASQSRRSVEQRLQEKLVVVPLIVYNNKPKVNIDVKAADYLVFTSPLNFETYHRAYSITATSRYVAIGPSTAQAFLKVGVPCFRVASAPGQQALAATVLAWEVEEPRLA